MTDDFLEKQKEFALSIPKHFIHNSGHGAITYSRITFKKYFPGTGDLVEAFSGSINQFVLNSDINYTYYGSATISSLLWGFINQLGYKQATDTPFIFLAVTNRVNMTLNDGTVFNVPIFYLGGTGTGTDPTTITMTGGTAEVKDQIIIDTDHPPTIEIDLSGSSTYIIDNANKMTNVTFKISDGSVFNFLGDSPTDTSIVLTNTDGTTTSTY
ncbi:hypothetical protein COMNV_01478 [Commensalibacter sp. Nvir]|uniref:hypothetical protein n=1 Tax=Commensalibacter sp. Nvir TaxID=3069817 RepID=UPI002D3DC604|nr:hypothetical protein COMNV_01478 [Commensalibacter sp. Nvir]